MKLETEKLPVTQISLSQFDIRISKQTRQDEDFAALVESVKEIGVRIPIHVIKYKNKLEVIDGGRRLRAAKVAGLKTVPVLEITDIDTEQEIRRDALTANVHRKDLEHAELGEALIKYYKTAGLKPEEIQSAITHLYSIDRKKSEKPREDEGAYRCAPLSNKLQIPLQTQKFAIDWVLKTDAEIRKKAEDAEVPRKTKEKLISPGITKGKDKQQRKKSQQNIIDEYKEASKATEKRTDAAVQNEEEKIADKEKKSDGKIPTFEESIEILEAEKSDRELNPRAMIGVLNGGLSHAWQGLTRQKYIPTTEVKTVEDLRQKYIEPTREFRKYFADNISKAYRTQIGNSLLFVKIAIQDMQDVLEKADATAYDTRE